jgi:tetratricopeptide (TPR) repeat protein
MKKIFFITILTGSALAMQAQSLEEGNKALYYERYSTAENTFRQALAQDANNAAAWYGITEALLNEEQVDKAHTELQHAPAGVQNEPYFKVAEGAVFLQEGRSAEAMNDFNQALNDTKQKDEGVLAAVARANIEAKKGDLNFAIDLLNKAIKRDKHNASFYVLLGDAYLKQQNGSGAYKAYEDAIEQDKNYAAAYHRIGEIFQTQKNPELYVDYFKKAIAADPNYAPSLYSLYAYEFYHDPAQAMKYYSDYSAKSDPSIQKEYDLADLLYLNKQYNEAINKANEIVAKEGEKVQPRLYKLIGYSYAGEKDTSKAIDYMAKYFANQNDTAFVAKDFISMGEFYASRPDQDSLAMVYYAKGVSLEQDSTQLTAYYKKLADLARDQKDYSAEAIWDGKYYASNERASNIDLFNWGLAHYRAEEYDKADSVFGLYVAKYPDQSFGYYWQAKSKALQDKDMKEGLAIDAYKKLIEVLEKTPTDPNYKKWIVDAYGYLAAYEANTEQNYAEAKGYFEKVLEVDPENADAKKYIDILDKSLADKGTK